jgi:hypothetical protein
MVGDHPRHPRVGQRSLDLRQPVHRPDQAWETDTAQRARGGQPLMHDEHVGAGAPEAARGRQLRQAPVATDQKSGAESRLELLRSTDHIVVKGGEQAAAKPEAAQQRHDVRNASALLELDVDRDPIARELQDLLESGRARVAARQRRVAYARERQAVCRGIVLNHQPAVSRSPHVELDHVRAQLDCRLESLERVLGGRAPGAAMGDDRRLCRRCRSSPPAWEPDRIRAHGVQYGARGAERSASAERAGAPVGSDPVMGDAVGR